MTMLVTGCGGQVGTELLRRARAHGIDVIGLSHQELDITRSDQVDAALSRLPVTVVVNAAAYTAVDRAEHDKAAAFAVNRDGPANLAQFCTGQGIPLIHISTDYVFDGNKPGPYTENDPVAPLGVYGASKAAGEQAVRELAPKHVILRTAWVYSAHGHNFVKTMLRLGRERDEIGVVADQVGCPTAAGEIAVAIITVIKAMQAGGDPWGTYHFCAAGQASWYQFACRIFEIASRYRPYPVTVKPIPGTAYPTPVRRPANSVLDCSRIEETFDLDRRPWPGPLADVLGEIHNN
ncbi:MAG: dTDP-4-dehydrorhamnose reductase [Gammaproteobacteria bacterium]|nr:MAG: dTDP-4-dehydrorhamnose reductase [Gammaproteobacteria bacterium]TND06710.1 MAG: dTDP-4-dehydrorhamnose reductase [Gammaproteobacteria bacterium]